MRPISSIIIHCSDTPASMDIGAHEIDTWHKLRGWLCIGYHFVVRRGGSVELGRPIAMVGAHCYGNNANSIGICLVGSKGDHTSEQWNRAVVLVGDLLHQLGLPVTAIHGHREFNPGKTCPDFDVAERFIPDVVRLLTEPFPDVTHELGDDQLPESAAMGTVK